MSLFAEFDELIDEKKLNTKDRVLYTAIELISEKGYKTVTIREIAEQAGVSEMTVFRHFGNKMNMLEAAIDRFYYPIALTEIFEKQLSFELKEDLNTIGWTYYELMKRNQKILKIAYKEGGEIPGMFEWVSKSPRQFKDLLMEYLRKMQRLGKVKHMNTFKLESHALLFISVQYGSIIARMFVEGHRVSFLTDSEIIEESVQLFYEALRME